MRHSPAETRRQKRYGEHMKRYAPVLIAFFFVRPPFTPAQWRSPAGIGEEVGLSTQSKKACTLDSDNRMYSFSGSGWQEYPGEGRGPAIAVTRT